MSDSDLVSVVVVTSIFWVVAMLVGREVVCWYWKINKSLALQEKILDELEKVNKSQLGN